MRRQAAAPLMKPLAAVTMARGRGRWCPVCMGGSPELASTGCYDTVRLT